MIEQEVIITKEMWPTILDMFYSNNNEDIFLAIGILSECSLKSFDVVGCWHMKQIYDMVLCNDVLQDIHMFVIRTVQWLKGTKEWKEMRKIEEELKTCLVL